MDSIYRIWAEDVWRKAEREAQRTREAALAKREASAFYTPRPGNENGSAPPRTGLRRAPTRRMRELRKQYEEARRKFPIQNAKAA